MKKTLVILILLLLMAMPLWAGEDGLLRQTWTLVDDSAAALGYFKVVDATDIDTSYGYIATGRYEWIQAEVWMDTVAACGADDSTTFVVKFYGTLNPSEPSGDFNLKNMFLIDSTAWLTPSEAAPQHYVKDISTYKVNYMCITVGGGTKTDASGVKVYVQVVGKRN